MKCSCTHTGLSIGFDNTEYAVSEDGGMLEVCLMFRGPLKNDSFVELKILLIHNTTQGVHNI